jgi:hypothetical protein
MIQQQFRVDHHTAVAVCPGHPPFFVNHSSVRPVNADPTHFLVDKYLDISEDIMDTINELSTAERIEAQRQIIRPSMNEISTDVESELKQSGLNFPVFVTVPNSGDAILSVASPLDSSDLD